MPESEIEMQQIISNEMILELERLRLEHIDNHQIMCSLGVREKRYRQAIEAAQGVVYELDFKTNRYIYLGEGIERLIGYSAEAVDPTLFSKISSLLHWRGEFTGITVAQAVPRFRSGEFSYWSADYACKTKTGETRWIYDTSILLWNEEGEAYGCLGILQDITERKLMEEQILQSQKMEALGRMAGSIAHDFNNMLSALGGFSDLALDTLDKPEIAQENLLRIRVVVERATNLTSQLLALARRQIIEPRIVEMNQSIIRMIDILERLLGEDISIVTNLSLNLWKVRVDTGQLDQILVNLAINARDAMPQGGIITIETRCETLQMWDVQQYPGVAAGDYVIMTVNDTGTGIPPELHPHVFEPFFTTKEIGKGTGLGLATCHGIVKQNGGHIKFFSEPDKGTTFTIYLPRADSALIQTVQTDQTPMVRGRETILVVEDELMLLEMASKALRSNGYTVMEASNGIDALELANNHPDEIHLLLTDVVMPMMSGKQVAEQLSKFRPNIPVLYVSGYTADIIAHHGILDDGILYLPKPYTLKSLVRKVREVLDSSMKDISVS